MSLRAWAKCDFLFIERVKLTMNTNWRTKPWGEATLVELDGEIDLHSAPDIKAALIELGTSPAARIAVDLSAVSFLDSTGIGALVGALKKTRECGGQMAFYGARDRVKRVFQIAGLLGALPFYPSREGALAALLPSPQFVAQTDDLMAQIAGDSEARSSRPPHAQGESDD